ncbi:MAG TPA: L,D-transpeptidase [Longimicrobium sp.]|jgi:hypothetical protein
MKDLMRHTRWALAALLAAAAAAPLAAQQQVVAVADTTTRPGSGAPVDNRPRGLVTREELITDRLRRLGIPNPDPAPTSPKTRADSLEWNRHRRAADRITGRKILVSIYERRLWLIDEDGDTLINTPVGVGMGVARKGNNSYDFSTPRGPRRVLGKEENPFWVPPDWHYWGMARRVRPFPAGGVELAEGGRVVRRGDTLGILKDGAFEPLPREHPLMWDGIMYIPPFGTIQRQIPEVLGKFKLDTGEGILIHGTNDPLAIGFPATHGCIRVADEPLEELYGLVEVGTPVYIY